MATAKEKYEEELRLINKAIEKAIADGCEIKIKIWEGHYEREQGTPYYRDIEEHCPNLSEELLWIISSCYGKGGCAEIIASDKDNEYCLYHEEEGESYLCDDLFDFL